MGTFFRLPPELWQCVVGHLESVTDVISVYDTNVYFRHVVDDVFHQWLRCRASMYMERLRFRRELLFLAGRCSGEVLHYECT